MDTTRVSTLVSIPADTINKVLNYLQTRPFGEVHALISEVMEKADEAVVVPDEGQCSGPSEEG